MQNELTDAQCDEFRRHNGDFNAMVRAIFKAGQARRQAEPSLEDERDKWKMVDADCRDGTGGLLTYHVYAFDEGFTLGWMQRQVGQDKPSRSAYDICMSRSHSLGADGLSAAANEAHKCASAVWHLSQPTTQAGPEPFGYVFEVNRAHTFFSKQLPPGDGYDAGTLVEVFAAPQPAQVPEFVPVANRKLAELKAKGLQINGYALRAEVDGVVTRCFIDQGGFVGWWNGPKAYAQTMAAHTHVPLPKASPAPLMSNEYAVLHKAFTVLPLPEDLAEAMFDGLTTDAKAQQFSNYNWFVAGTACAEEWQRLYIDAALQAQAANRK